MTHPATTTLTAIRAESPCEPGWAKLRPVLREVS